MRTLGASRRQGLLQLAREMVRDLVDAGLVAAFDHDAGLELGPRITDQDAAGVAGLLSQERDGLETDGKLGDWFAGLLGGGGALAAVAGLFRVGLIAAQALLR